MKIKKIVRPPLLFLLNFYLKLRGINIHPTARVSLKANLDFTNPSGIYIGEGSYVAFGATLLSHDFVRSIHTDTRVGKNSFIGANSIILPGVIVGDGSIVAAGSVVTKHVPDNSIVAGNPAIVIRSEIKTRTFGQLINNG